MITVEIPKHETGLTILVSISVRSNKTRMLPAHFLSQEQRKNLSLKVMKRPPNFEVAP